MKQTLLIIISLLVCTMVHGQDSLKIFPKTIGIEYFGELVLHPGLKIDYGIPLWTNYKLVGKKDKLFFQHINVRPHVGFYHLPKYTNNYFIGTDLGIQFRIENPSKGRYFFFESHFGIRYMRYSYIGTIYQSNSNGSFEKRNSGGGNSFLVASGFTLGGSLPFKKIGWTMGFEYLPEFSDDKLVIQHFIIKLGVRIKLKP